MRGRPLLPLGSSCSPDTKLIALFALRPLCPPFPPPSPPAAGVRGEGEEHRGRGAGTGAAAAQHPQPLLRGGDRGPGREVLHRAGAGAQGGGGWEAGGRGGGGVPLCAPPSSTPITQPEGFLSSPRITPKTGTPAGAGDRWRTMRVSAPHCPPPWCFGGMGGGCGTRGGSCYAWGGGPCFTRGSATVPPTDDGKIFHGSGVGDPFGPRCYKGDTMGCGIMFPRDYSLDSEGGWGAGRGGVRHRDPPQG